LDVPAAEADPLPGRLSVEGCDVEPRVKGDGGSGEGPVVMRVEGGGVNVSVAGDRAGGGNLGRKGKEGARPGGGGG